MKDNNIDELSACNKGCICLKSILLYTSYGVCAAEMPMFEKMF